MKDYVSVMHCTSNEDGKEELMLEATTPLWQVMISTILNRPCESTQKAYYVVNGTCWEEKFTGVVPNSEMQFELFECKGYVKRESERIAAWDAAEAVTNAAFDRAFKAISQQLDKME